MNQNFKRLFIWKKLIDSEAFHKNSTSNNFLGKFYTKGKSFW